MKFLCKSRTFEVIVSHTERLSHTEIEVPQKQYTTWMFYHLTAKVFLVNILSFTLCSVIFFAFHSGYYCDFGDQPISNYTEYLCPIGYYCPTGTEFATQYGCPAGTYSPYLQLTSAEECTFCPSGKYCYGSNETYTGKCKTRSHAPLIPGLISFI